jgi:UDP-N-acetylmuramoyl-tripeptide--D-alanyl-D-alanine ligase
MRSSLAVLNSSLAGAIMTADAQFDGVSTDSRNVSAGNLFVALRGENFDAHQFLEQVVAKAAAAVIVERLPEGLKVPALIVPDTRVALGEIANQWRHKFSMPLIAVTGSNGKTTVKEMIASILIAAYGKEYCMATRGNFNNEIGVPLTLIRLDEACRAAVIELGMNQPGEIELLSKIARPTLGLVNNAQREHQEFMASVEAVAQENGAVISNLAADGIAVFPAADPFTPLWRAYAESKGKRKVVTFGLGVDADVHCSYQPNDFGSDMLIDMGRQKFGVRLSAVGEHNVLNALAAVACTFAIGIGSDAIRRGLEAFEPVNGRLQRKTSTIGAEVIDDTYNANPDSVRAAIDVLAQAGAPRLLVLGDMGEVGNEGPGFHEEVGAYASQRGIELLFTLGDLARHSCSAFGARARHFDAIDVMNRQLDETLSADMTVLVKGSRFMKMERVVQHLIFQPTRGVH